MVGNGNVLSNGEKHVRLIHKIKMILRNGDTTVVLLDVPESERLLNNICCFDKDLNIMWRSEPLEKLYPNLLLLPYEDICIRDGYLYAWDFYCRSFQIDLNNGKVLGFKSWH